MAETGTPLRFSRLAAFALSSGGADAGYAAAV